MELTSCLLNFIVFETLAALAFGYRFAWSEDRFLVEAGLIEFCDLLD